MSAGVICMNRLFVLTLVALLGITVAADAQFRRGMFGESTEVTLYPLEAPVVLLPAGTVRIDARNASSASARSLERVKERFARQLADNDDRLDIVDTGAAMTLVATITEWNEARRNSSKYVSETRQVGTRETVDKNGKKKTEPVYEYGRNRPSVVINATAVLRVEVRSADGTVLADESARHAINEEYLLDAGPPSRDEIQDLLIDGVVQTAAARVSPGRRAARAMLARSDAVDDLNALAQSRDWSAWLARLEDMAPHRDRKREAYRIHNLAVAHEALAYDAEETSRSRELLARARVLAAQANAMNPDEKYFAQATERIGRSIAAYARLDELSASVATLPAAEATPRAPSAPSAAPVEAPPAAAMTNTDVIDLRKAGLNDGNLIAAINDAPSVRFDLSPAGLRALLAAKVSNAVIAAMRAR
jgi:hypothetical protein